MVRIHPHSVLFAFKIGHVNFGVFQVVLASCLFMQAVASPIFPFDLFKRGGKKRQTPGGGGYNAPRPQAAPANNGYSAAAPAQSGYGAAQACRTEYDNQCTTVNEQQCSTVNRQQCSTVQEQQCSTVNEQVRQLFLNNLIIFEQLL